MYQFIAFRIITLLQLSNYESSVHGFRVPYHTVSLPEKSIAKISLNAKKSTNSLSSRTTTGSTSGSRQNRIQSLLDWAESSNIKIAKSFMNLRNDATSGLGWYSQSKEIPSGSVIVSVPTDVALSVEAPGEGPNNFEVIKKFGKQVTDYPWFVQMSLYLNTLKKQPNQQNLNYQTWLDSLPSSFETPFHWNNEILKELQYDYLIDSVQRQKNRWNKLYDQVNAKSSLSYEDFVWGCECARSRAFSGTYTGSAFNPALYAFVLLLVTIYVGLNIGTLEQAANGAGVVLSFSVLKDFVLPKLFKKKRYVVCPMIDMANHKSIGCQAEVAFEYFANAYSMATSKGSPVASSVDQIYISYGTRSNDQLLQYYGFVESDNPHDVYVMPPLRDWDIAALEQACGRKIASGRLAKLEQAGLLGSKSSSIVDSEDEGEERASVRGGVVLSRVLGLDPAVFQALRALISTEEEWKAAGESIGNFSEENSGGNANERCAKLAAKTAIEIELRAKPTTIEEDEKLLRQMDTLKSMDTASREERLAVLFRIEKKKLLQECIYKLQ